MPTLIILPGWGGITKPGSLGLKANENFDTHCIDLPFWRRSVSAGGLGVMSTHVWNAASGAPPHRKANPPWALFEDKWLCARGQSPEYFRGLIPSAAAVRHLARFETSFSPSRRAENCLQTSIIERGSVLQKSCFTVLLVPDYAKTSEIQREIFRKIYGKISGISARHRAPDATSGTLIYSAVQDGKAIAELMPNACLRLIRGAGHGLHLRNTDGLLRELRSFAAAIP